MAGISVVGALRRFGAAAAAADDGQTTKSHRKEYGISHDKRLADNVPNPPRRFCVKAAPKVVCRGNCRVAKGPAPRSRDVRLSPGGWARDLLVASKDERALGDDQRDRHRLARR